VCACVHNCVCVCVCVCVCARAFLWGDDMFALLLCSKRKIHPFGRPVTCNMSECVLQYVTVYCSVLQCVAVLCSVLQGVAVRCSALRCVAVRCSVVSAARQNVSCSLLQFVAVCCIHHAATHCNARNRLQHTARKCNAL